jgi:preprotein translocase subunit SecE
LAKNNIPVKAEVKVKNRVYNIKEYFISVYSELKRVHWPNRKQILVYTGVVIFMVLLVMLILWLFDTGLSTLLRLLNDRFNGQL